MKVTWNMKQSESYCVIFLYKNSLLTLADGQSQIDQKYNFIYLHPKNSKVECVNFPQPPQIHQYRSSLYFFITFQPFFAFCFCFDRLSTMNRLSRHDTRMKCEEEKCCWPATRFATLLLLYKYFKWLLLLYCGLIEFLCYREAFSY